MWNSYAINSSYFLNSYGKTCQGQLSCFYETQITSPTPMYYNITVALESYLTLFCGNETNGSTQPCTGQFWSQFQPSYVGSSFDQFIVNSTEMTSVFDLFWSYQLSTIFGSNGNDYPNGVGFRVYPSTTSSVLLLHYASAQAVTSSIAGFVDYSVTSGFHVFENNTTVSFFVTAKG